MDHFYGVTLKNEVSLVIKQILINILSWLQKGKVYKMNDKLDNNEVAKKENIRLHDTY